MAEIKNNITNLSDAPMEIVVDDGSVRVPIKNRQGGEVGVFYFRPTDMGIIDRYNQLAGDFEKITAPLETVNINPDGTANGTDEAELAALREAEQNLYAACDKLFGGNMSEAFFGKMHPFSPVGGRFYCENVLEAVGQYISRQFSREVRRVNSRVEKYTHGYKTGKHKNGRRP